ncbi:hypothetical protein OG598_05315 [Micromonospora sp. NBC_00330]|uniref:DUF7003 family protein n=1 Tax=Micromonospora sp. NBC_00330 TaxID=2903585 RepID=UPI002E286692|nr:hypothetical protein [Micromonospora sp. NBC_00330]
MKAAGPWPITVAAERGEELVDVLRRLVPDHRELLLADEVELRRRIPADIPEIIRLDQWPAGRNHPTPRRVRPMGRSEGRREHC